LKKLFLNARHLNISIICCFGHFCQIRRDVRSQINHFMFTGNFNDHEVHNIYNDFKSKITAIESKNHLKNLFKECSLKKSSLIVSQRQKDANYLYKHVFNFINPEAKMYNNKAFEDIASEFQ